MRLPQRLSFCWALELAKFPILLTLLFFGATATCIKLLPALVGLVRIWLRLSPKFKFFGLCFECLVLIITMPVVRPEGLLFKVMFAGLVGLTS